MAGCRQKYIVGRTEGAEVCEALSVNRHPDQEVFSEEVVEAFVVEGPTAVIQLDSVDSVVGNLKAFVEEVVPFRGHKQKAGGKEGRQ